LRRPTRSIKLTPTMVMQVLTTSQIIVMVKPLWIPACAATLPHHSYEEA
jgi:hypothetical protein